MNTTMKVSKILEAIIAQVTFDTMKSGKNYMLKDQLMLALLRYDGTFAQNILRDSIDDWQLYQIALRIENSLENGSKSEVEIPEIFFDNYLRQLHNSQKTSELSTLNAVIDILSDSTTASHDIFRMYGVRAVYAYMFQVFSYFFLPPKLKPIPE